MNFSEAFAQAMAAGAAVDGNGLTPEQHVIRLREVMALRAEIHTFTPGQILIHRYPDLSQTRDSYNPQIFMNYLDQPIRGVDMMDLDDIGSSCATFELDCMVGRIVEGKTFMTFFMDSKWLKPHPDFTEE